MSGTYGSCNYGSPGGTYGNLCPPFPQTGPGTSFPVTRRNGWRPSLHQPTSFPKNLEERKWYRAVIRQFDEPRVRPVFSVGDETSNARTLTIRVVGRIGQGAPSRYSARVIVGTAPGGAPGGTQTVVVNAGSVVQTVAANQVFDVLTSDDGVIVVTITTGSGSQTRYVTVLIEGEAYEQVLTWT